MSEPEKQPPVARIPIGAVLKMFGGEFHVTNAEPRSLTLRGPLARLKKGMILNLFGVIAQVTLVGHAVARLRAQSGGMFDTRPILRLTPEAEDAKPPEPPGKQYLNATEHLHQFAVEYEARLAAFQAEAEREATEEERATLVRGIIS